MAPIEVVEALQGTLDTEVMQGTAGTCRMDTGAPTGTESATQHRPAPRIAKAGGQLRACGGGADEFTPNFLEPQGRTRPSILR